MAKIKYNFDELKVEFFKSKTPEVKKFFEDKFNTYTAHIRKYTAGWTKDKQNYIRTQIQEAEAEYQIEKKKRWKQVIKNIDTAQMAGLQMFSTKVIQLEKVTSQINQMAKDWVVNKSKLKELLDISEALNAVDKTSVNDMLKMFKLEKWEATENIWSVNTKSSLMELLEEAEWEEY